MTEKCTQHLIKCNYNKTYNQTRKVHAYMMHYNDSSEQTNFALLQSFKILGLAKLLHQSGIRKASGVSAYEVFKFLLLLVFEGKKLYRYLDSKRADKAVSKNTYYRLLNESTFNW